MWLRVCRRSFTNSRCLFSTEILRKGNIFDWKSWRFLAEFLDQRKVKGFGVKNGAWKTLDSTSRRRSIHWHAVSPTSRFQTTTPLESNVSTVLRQYDRMTVECQHLHREIPSASCYLFSAVLRALVVWPMCQIWTSSQPNRAKMVKSVDP